MDDCQPPAKESHLPLQGPHRPQPSVELPPHFFPLRLLLQPSGTTFELAQVDTLIGRHTEADIRLPLPDVSRRHCRFVFCEKHWHLIDLDSLNGVFVNGQRVRQAVLQHGDVVRIGGFAFQVDLHASAASPANRPGKSTHVLKSIADALPYPEANANQEKRRAS